VEGNIATYQIEVLNEQFVHKINSCNETILVKTFIENKLYSQTKYGLITKEQIYNLLKEEKELNLSGCYVKDFSISEYKRIIDFEDATHIKFNNFIAEGAFFDCTLGTDFSYIDFTGRVKFSNSIFSHGNVSFYHSQFSDDSNVDFKGVQFGNGEINFQYVDFGNVDVLFSSARFYGGLVSFVNSNFKDGNALFNNVFFYNSKVKFHYAKFGNGNISFQKSKFGIQTVDFRRVEFGIGRVDFRRAVFGDGYITFDESEIIDGKFNFKSARFGNNDMSFKAMDFGASEVLFEKVNFGTGRISFTESVSKYISFKGSRLDVFLDLTVKNANVIDLSETVLRGIIDLKSVNHKVHIDTIYLNGMRNLGRLIIDWKENGVKKLIKSQKKTTFRQKSEQFNILKEDFHLSGQYEDEDKSYIQFKRYELRADYQKTLKRGGVELFKLPNYLFRWIIFDKMGLYATSPLRVLVSMFVIYAMFSVLYLLMPILNFGNIINSVGATDGLTYIQTCFYHSAITFLTIGYGDYYPTGVSRGVSVVEGWMGLFLMSYFTVAFVRKILR